MGMRLSAQKRSMRSLMAGSYTDRSVMMKSSCFNTCP